MSRMTRREARASLARGGAEASASLPKAESPRLLRRQWRAQHVSPAQAEASTGSGSRGPGERAPRSRRSGRTPRRGPGAFAKFGLAACAILGIGAALTSAAWSDTVAFESDVQIAQFQMEYSWTNADGSWHPFVSGGQIRLDQINQWIDPSTQMTPHWIFVRNLGQSSTNIRIDVTRGGVFENRDS